MNWVGGSRTRIMFKQEKRKQKEYFEKKRLQSKAKSMEISSPAKHSSVSLDLLNMYVVNQISTKKEKPVTVPMHVNLNKGSKMPLRRYNVELPMSPCFPPSKLCLDDMQWSKQQHGLDDKRKYISDELPLYMESEVTHSEKEHQNSRVEKYSVSPTSLFAEWSSYNQFSNQNASASPWEIAFEEKKKEQNLSFSQPGNVSYEDFMVSKLGGSQNIVSQPHNRRSSDMWFEQLSCPDHWNSNDDFKIGTSNMMIEKDHGSRNRRESYFGMEREKGERNQPSLEFYKDENQSVHNILSKDIHSFVHKESTSFLPTDQQDMNLIFDNRSSSDTKNVYNFPGWMDGVSIWDQQNNLPRFQGKSSVDRNLKSVFTVPDQPFGNPGIPSKNYNENNQLNNNPWKEYNSHQRNDYSASFEHQDDPVMSGKRRKLENYEEATEPSKNFQNYPYKHIGNLCLKESLHKSPQDLGFSQCSTSSEAKWTCHPTLVTLPSDEIFVREEEKDGLEASPKILNGKMGCDSSLSSQSPSYSPRQTESLFSSSPAMPSEEEDLVLPIEHPESERNCKNETSSNSRQPASSTEFPNHFPPCVESINRGVKGHEQTDNFYPSGDNSGLSQCDSRNNNNNRNNNHCYRHIGQRDAWSQTEDHSVPEGKSDVGVQCDMMREREERKHLFPISAGDVPEVTKADSIRGQEIPSDEALRSINLTNSPEHQPEVNYLCLNDPGVLDLTMM
ncbi:uncharacterized protein C12orf40 homolog [Tachyglossus aculeatus]|uniref:uncharacterized protein C12orf40 homolog n=1 Tax=Tachyglossus aculeatus TaxID=9261 RepID=UPI0018F62D0B|nr:uncharacterized protein C12orf40 homolog [Tachyglossus aculeatus]